MHSAVSPALGRPRSARGPVAGNNSEGSCIHAEGENGQLGHSGRLMEVEIDSDPPAVLSASMCRTTPVAICRLFGSCIVGHSRPLKRKFSPKHFFARRRKSLREKKSHLFLQLKTVQGHPGWVSFAGSVFFAKDTLTEHARGGMANAN
jgi:hypothetical protein